MDWMKKENKLISHFEKFQKQMDNLYWKKNPNWYLEFKQFDDEEFKPIIEYYGFYFISNYGKVASFKRGLPILVGYLISSGFLTVNLRQDGIRKNHYVHELVFTHFVGKLVGDRRVIHKNNYVTDNYYRNLRLSRITDTPENFKKLYDFSLLEQCKFIGQNGLFGAAPILQFNKKGKYLQEFSSVMEAVEILDLNPSSLMDCLKGKTRLAGEHQWRYKHDPIFKDGIFDIQPIPKRKVVNHKAVYQFDLKGHFIREYASITEACQAVEPGSHGIFNCLGGRNITFKGFQWRLKSDPLFENGIVNIPPVVHRNTNKPKPVLQYSLRGKFIREFPSISEAVLVTGLSGKDITNCIKKKTKTGGRYQWRLKQGLKKGEEIKDIEPVKRNRHIRFKRAVYQFSLEGKFIKGYTSITEASRKTPALRGCIRKCANKKQKIAGGFQWRFKSDPAFANGITDIESIQKGSSQTAPISFRMGKSKRKRKRKRTFFDMSIPVLQFDGNGKFLFEYPSLKEAAKAVGRIPYDIIQCIKGERKNTAGFQWRFKNDPSFKKGLCDIGPIIKKVHSNAVFRFDLKGKYMDKYPSLKEASKAVGVTVGAISASLKTAQKTSGGFQWRYQSDPIFKDGIVDIPPVEKVCGWVRKDILQFDLQGKFIRQYPSIMAAARASRISASTIRKALYGYRYTAGGFQWRSINDPLFEKGIVDIGPTGERYKRSRPILQYDKRGKLKNEYRCIQDAVKKTGISRVSIVRCAKGEYKAAGGFLWKFKNS